MNKIVKSFFKGAAIICLSAFVLASCDPEKGKEELNPDDKDPTEQPEPDQPVQPEDPVNPKADSLENALQRQVRAMYQISSEETLLLASVAQSKQAGLYDMSFETGASFKVYVPVTEGTKTLSFVDNGGVKYWAAVGQDGNSAAVKNDAGNMLSAEVEPVVKLVSDEYCLVSESEVYHTGYVADDAVQALECTLLADNAGEVYAVNYSLGSSNRTVYVSTYQYAKFYLAADEAKEQINDLHLSI